MTDEAWLDNEIDFEAWSGAWRAGWRLGTNLPTIVLDYNGLESYPWQVYFTDDSHIEHNGRLVRAGAASGTRRRLTDRELVQFLDMAFDYAVEVGKANPMPPRDNISYLDAARTNARYGVNQIGVSMCNGAFDTWVRKSMLFPRRA